MVRAAASRFLVPTVCTCAADRLGRCACVYAWIRACMCVCMCIHVYACAYVFVCVRARMRACTRYIWLVYFVHCMYMHVTHTRVHTHQTPAAFLRRNPRTYTSTATPPGTSTDPSSTAVTPRCASPPHTVTFHEILPTAKRSIPGVHESPACRSRR